MPPASACLGGDLADFGGPCPVKEVAPPKSQTSAIPLRHIGHSRHTTLAMGDLPIAMLAGASGSVLENRSYLTRPVSAVVGGAFNLVNFMFKVILTAGTPPTPVTEVTVLSSQYCNESRVFVGSRLSIQWIFPLPAACSCEMNMC